MSDVKRYSPAEMLCSRCGKPDADLQSVMVTTDDGMFVRWDDYARLKAEVERLRKAGDWHTIETAPKDGKTIVLIVEYGYVHIGFFDNRGYCQDLTGAGLDPSHWMHLPNPPAAKEGKPSV